MLHDENLHLRHCPLKFKLPLKLNIVLPPQNFKFECLAIIIYLGIIFSPWCAATESLTEVNILSGQL